MVHPTIPDVCESRSSSELRLFRMRPYRAFCDVCRRGGVKVSIAEGTADGGAVNAKKTGGLPYAAHPLPQYLVFYFVVLLSFRALLLPTFRWSKPSPKTPMTALCDTKALGSMSLMMRKMVFDWRLLANTNMIFCSLPV